MMITAPRLIIAGTQSGVGKTSLSLGLVAALARRGMRVQTYKVGPDFLDPSYLTLASGRPCYNLDGWMCGKDYVRRLFSRTSQDADICIIEGVMGLFDGSDAVTSEGSTAEIAERLGAPVILVVNAHGAARSLAATVKGFAEFDPKIKVVGILANQTGSERHASWLRDSLAGVLLPPLVGAIPRGILPGLPSRHLGLVTADQKNLSKRVLDELADAVEKHVEIDSILRLAEQAKAIDAPTQARDSSATYSSGTLRLGVAHDEAFHFYYQDCFDELQLRGCELIRFSPIRDRYLPNDLHGLYIGGGYPEEFAEALSQNQSMRMEVRRFAAEGHPVYAECGGLMYLANEIRKLDGYTFPMAGLMPSSVQMLPRKKMLGYVEATLTQDSLIGIKGIQLRGHEFHYSELSNEPSTTSGWERSYMLTKRRSTEIRLEGFQRGNVLASYVHLHLASRPEAMERFLGKCKKHCGQCAETTKSTRELNEGFL